MYLLYYKEMDDRTKYTMNESHYEQSIFYSMFYWINVQCGFLAIRNQINSFSAAFVYSQLN